MCSTSHTRIEILTSGSGRGQKSYIQSTLLEKRNGPGQSISNASKTTDGPRVSPLGDHMKIKDDKGDQPSGGETTWTNTGGTRYGRGQHNTPNHGTHRLPNDGSDDDD